MGASVHRKWCEPVYRQLLAGMTDEELDRELGCIRSMLKTTPKGPHYEHVWKHDCLKHEFTRRGRIPSEGFD